MQAFVRLLRTSIFALLPLAACQTDQVQPQKSAVTIPQDALTEIDAVGTELADLFGDLCLSRFPDEAAFQEGAKAKQLIALSPQAVKVFLHDDRGRGWAMKAASGPGYIITVENPPYHACAVRRIYDAAPKFQLPYQLMIKLWTANNKLGPIQEIKVTPQKAPQGATAKVTYHVVPGPDGKPSRSFMSFLTEYLNGKAEVRLVHQIPKM